MPMIYPSSASKVTRNTVYSANFLQRVFKTRAYNLCTYPCPPYPAIAIHSTEGIVFVRLGILVVIETTMTCSLFIISDHTGFDLY